MTEKRAYFKENHGNSTEEKSMCAMTKAAPTNTLLFSY